MTFSKDHFTRRGFGAVIPALLALLLTAPSPALAVEAEAAIIAPILEAGEYTNVLLAESIESTARWLDTFLGGEEAYEGNTGSLLQITTKTVISRYDDLKSESSVRARFVLPRTQERLNLVLQSDTGEDEEASEDKTLAGDLIPVEKVSGFGAALEGILLETAQWKAAIRGGVRTRIPPDAFVRFDLRRRWLVGDGRATIDEKVYWYAVAGYVNKLRVYWDLPSKDGLYLRPSAGTNWEEENPGFTWNYGIGMYKKMSEVDVLAYDLRSSGERLDHPKTLGYTAVAELRHKLYSNWVYLGVGPGISWNKELDFRPNAFFGVKFDFIFSKELTDVTKFPEEEQSTYQ